MRQGSWSRLKRRQALRLVQGRELNQALVGNRIQAAVEAEVGTEAEMLAKANVWVRADAKINAEIAFKH